MSNTIGTGDAPCGCCGKIIMNIPIILETAEPDGLGGTWYQVDGKQTCLSCGELLHWYHIPAKSPYMLGLECIQQGNIVDTRAIFAPAIDAAIPE